jgi:uncharacterized protein YcbX
VAPRCVDGAVHLTGLFIHPVKSLRSCAVAAAEVDALGLVGDRRFLVVDEFGRFLTQRTLPRMARVATALSPDTLTLSSDGAGEVRVSRAADPAAPLRTVSIWKSEGLQAEDCGDAPAQWLSDSLAFRCRLVRIGPAFQRPVLKPKAHPGDVFHFADACPFLIISEATLDDLNGRLTAQGHATLPMNRFRPNLVVADCSAFAEDTWPRIKIGGVVFRAGGPCSRCPITTTDQFTGERGKEPLRLLATYRRDAADPTNVNFGQNLIHETKFGRLRVGDAVEILS